MKYLLTLLWFVLIAPYYSIAQVAPIIQWQNTIGGFDHDGEARAIGTSDGGYIFVSQSLSGISGDKTEINYGSFDFWVVKVDAGGSITWQNTIGGNNIEETGNIIETVDGGYLIGGGSATGINGDKTEVSRGGYDYWVVKLNATGTITWQKTIGGSGSDHLVKVLQTTDGNYILGGYSDSPASGEKSESQVGGGSNDYWIVKLDTIGNILWQNTIGGNQEDLLTDINLTSDGGYIVAGNSTSPKSGDKSEKKIGLQDYWILKLDATGNIVWQNAIGGLNYDAPFSAVETPTGGFLIAGTSSSDIGGDKTEANIGTGDYWILKLNSAGVLIAQNTIGGTGDDEASSGSLTSDGNYLIGGNSSSEIGGDKTESSRGNYDWGGFPIQ